MVPHTYLILASRTQTLHFGQHVIFPCPKVSFRKRPSQHQKKELNHGFNTQIPSIYAYGQNTLTILGTFAILVVWWGGKNRIDIKWPKMHRLQKYLRCYCTHTRYAESQIKLLGINPTSKSFGSYHCFR